MVEKKKKVFVIDPNQSKSIDRLFRGSGGVRKGTSPIPFKKNKPH